VLLSPNVSVHPPIPSNPNATIPTPGPFIHVRSPDDGPPHPGDKPQSEHGGEVVQISSIGENGAISCGVV
jgi:hypothetical protein